MRPWNPEHWKLTMCQQSDGITLCKCCVANQKLHEKQRALRGPSAACERGGIINYLLAMACMTDEPTSKVLRDYAARIRNGAHCSYPNVEPCRTSTPEGEAAARQLGATHECMAHGSYSVFIAECPRCSSGGAR